MTSKDAIDRVAKALIGVPYENYGRDMRKGLDCFGLVIEFYKMLGLKIVDPVAGYTCDWYKQSNYIEDHKKSSFETVKDPIPGDLVVMKVQSFVPNHLAVVLDETWLLNTDKTIGVHRIRTFAVNQHIVEYLHHPKLKVKK